MITMQHKQPGVGKEAAILAGLQVTIEALAAREYWAEDGRLLRVRRLLVDAGYVPDQVYDAIRISTYADHLVAEYFLRNEARARTVDQWQLRPAKSDNHWLDCTVGAMVAASIEGVSLPGGEIRLARSAQPAERPSLSQLRSRS